MAERNERKERIGVVVSDKMNKSVVIEVQRKFMHPTYGKIVRLDKRYVAHDEKDECKIGDKVRITETRPLSKTKRWRVSEVLEKAK
ncbi:MAG TPA: 30S ribosomal protein S17 [Chitinispirillaceae bacterium]|jgi:small subunit ribosomal protein S17|nr:30S ribosomal protein S17 [Fibrobacter sp.]HLV31625.1 30S ribosomal protein S17 [Chitinispirillaceae bacterium]